MDPVTAYLRHLEVERRVAANTLSAYRRDLVRLQVFAKRMPKAATALTRSDLEALVRDAMTDGLSPTSAARLVASVRGFFRYLRLHGHVSENPAEDLHAPRLFAVCPNW
jgi:integrase/recombinase XerD